MGGGVFERVFSSKKYGPINLYTYVSLLVLFIVHSFNLFNQPVKEPIVIIAGLAICVACVTFFCLSLTEKKWLRRLRYAYVAISYTSMCILSIETTVHPSGFLLMSIWSTMISFLFVFPNIKYVIGYTLVVLVNFFIIYSNFVHHPEMKISTSMLDFIPGAVMIISIVGSTSYFRELNDLNIKNLVEEVTHRKKVEKELEKLNRVYTGIAENLPMQLAVLTSEGRYEYANRLMEPNSELRNYIHGMTDIEFFNKFKPTRSHIAIQRDRAIRDCIETGDSAINEVLDDKSFIRYYFLTKKSNTDSVEIISYGWEIKERRNA